MRYNWEAVPLDFFNCYLILMMTFQPSLPGPITVIVSLRSIKAVIRLSSACITEFYPWLHRWLEQLNMFLRLTVVHLDNLNISDA